MQAHSLYSGSFDPSALGRPRANTTVSGDMDSCLLCLQEINPSEHAEKFQDCRKNHLAHTACMRSYRNSHFAYCPLCDPVRSLAARGLGRTGGGGPQAARNVFDPIPLIRNAVAAYAATLPVVERRIKLAAAVSVGSAGYVMMDASVIRSLIGVAVSFAASRSVALDCASMLFVLDWGSSALTYLRGNLIDAPQLQELDHSFRRSAIYVLVAGLALLVAVLSALYSAIKTGLIDQK